MNAIQNSVTRDTPVQNQAAAISASAAPKTSAPPTSAGSGVPHPVAGAVSGICRVDILASACEAIPAH